MSTTQSSSRWLLVFLRETAARARSRELKLKPLPPQTLLDATRPPPRRFVGIIAKAIWVFKRHARAVLSRRPAHLQEASSPPGSPAADRGRKSDPGNGRGVKVQVKQGQVRLKKRLEDLDLDMVVVAGAFPVRTSLSQLIPRPDKTSRGNPNPCFAKMQETGIANSAPARTSSTVMNRTMSTCAQRPLITCASMLTIFKVSLPAMSLTSTSSECGGVAHGATS